MNWKKMNHVVLIAGAAACFAALALPLAAVAGGTALRNPPSECKAADSDCGCDSGEGVSDGCIKASLDMGRTTPWTGAQKCTLKVFADDQSPMVFTPESLFAVCGYTFRRVGTGVLPDGETPSEVVLSHPDGEAVRFVFSAGEPVGVPDPGLHSGMDERLMMVDAAGWACTNAPVYYDLFEGDGTVRRFLATDATDERGRLVSVTDARGVVRTPADMGVDVVLGADGVRQFLTPSRLADVRVLADGYEVRVYAISGDAPERDAATGLYPVPADAPVRTLSVRGSDGGRRAVVTLRRGDADPLVHVFDYAAGDWSLTRPSGVREVRERSVVDSKEARTTRETRSVAGGLLSRDEYAYAWRSWGFAATNHVEGFGVVSVTGSAVTPEFRFEEALSGGGRRIHVVRGETPASRRFSVREENMLGQVVREERGGFGGSTLATVHEYDNLGRLVRTASAGEPSVEFAYDALGERVATVRRADGAWRREETGTRHVLVDGEVWLVTTNVVSCSDAAIAPLVTSRAAQLTGLSAANLARSRETDVRGNVVEAWTKTADGVSSAFRRTPGASNAAVERSRLGVRMQTTSASLVTNSVVCDALGRVCEEIDGRGSATRTEYDAAGRRAAVYDGAGNPTRYAYDRAGRLAAVTNALGHAVVYEYDLRGRKTYEGGATYPVRYAYDVFGDRVSMTTYRDESKGVGSGDVTRWLRDEATGLVTNKVYADGMGPAYGYDANGRLTRRTWARGIVTDYAYDGWGNLTNTVYSDGTPDVSLRHDAMGRMVEARDAAGVTTFAYDAYGTVTDETVVGEVPLAEE